MALTYGFYDSISGDRLYNSSQMSSLFDGLIVDGVFSSIGTRLEVRPQGTGLQVLVGEGRAWFNHTWTLVDAEIILTHDAPHVTYPRYDAVVLEVNSDVAVRANDIKIIKGTAAATPAFPALTNTGTLHQYPLAYVYVPVGISTINSGNITNKVGTSACPYVTGVLTSFNIDSLIAQWGGEWDDWKDGQVTSFSDWMATRQSSFDSWWATFVDNLTSEQATNLQNEINDINSFIDNTFLTADRDYYVSTTGDNSNDGLSLVTPFRYIQKAVDVATQLILGPYNVTIHIADGTYEAENVNDSIVRLKGYSGQGSITIEGNLTTPSNVHLSTPNTSCIITGGKYEVFPNALGATYRIRGVKLTATQYVNSALSVGEQFTVIIDHIDFGQCGASHITVYNGGMVKVHEPGYSISGSASNHIYLLNYGSYEYFGAGAFFDKITMTNYINFSVAFLNITILSRMVMSMIGFVNSEYVTGKKYTVSTNSVVSISSITIPGTVAGTVVTGGQLL